MENALQKKFFSNCRSASQVSYVVVRKWLEILMNGFLIKNVLAVGGWWIYFGWWWVEVGGCGWWRMVDGGGGWWWVVA